MWENKKLVITASLFHIRCLLNLSLLCGIRIERDSIWVSCVAGSCSIIIIILWMSQNAECSDSFLNSEWDKNVNPTISTILSPMTSSPPFKSKSNAKSQEISSINQKREIKDRERLHSASRRWRDRIVTLNTLRNGWTPKWTLWMHSKKKSSAPKEEDRDSTSW